MTLERAIISLIETARASDVPVRVDLSAWRNKDEAYEIVCSLGGATRSVVYAPEPGCDGEPYVIESADLEWPNKSALHVQRSRPATSEEAAHLATAVPHGGPTRAARLP